MTPPPRLAPLETMTEDVRLRLELSSNPLVGICLAELEAQRLARARERREIYDDIIEALVQNGLRVADMTTDPCWSHIAVQDAVALVVALRDQEEA